MKTKLNRLLTASQRECAYNEANKKELFLAARAVLKQLAKDLSLTDYEVRYNCGGIAVSGETYLHADAIYIQLDQGFNRNKFMYRGCLSRKDYTGLVNEWMTYETLCLHYEIAVSRFKNTISCARKYKETQAQKTSSVS